MENIKGMTVQNDSASNGKKRTSTVRRPPDLSKSSAMLKYVKNRKFFIPTHLLLQVLEVSKDRERSFLRSLICRKTFRLDEGNVLVSSSERNGCEAGDAKSIERTGKGQHMKRVIKGKTSSMIRRRGLRGISLEVAEQLIDTSYPQYREAFDRIVSHYELRDRSFIFLDEAMTVLGRPRIWHTTFLRRYDPKGVVPSPNERKSLTLIPLDEVTKYRKEILKAKTFPSLPYEHKLPEDLRDRGYISLTEASVISGYSLHYVSDLLRNGRVAGVKYQSRGFWAVDRADLLRYVQNFFVPRGRSFSAKALTKHPSLFENKEVDSNAKPNRKQLKNTDFMTLREASDCSGIKSTLLRSLCNTGAMPGAKKVGHLWIIDRKAFSKVFTEKGLVVGKTLLRAKWDFR